MNNQHGATGGNLASPVNATDDIGGSTTILQGKIGQLTNLLTNVRDTFEDEKTTVAIKMLLWGMLLIFLVVQLYCFYQEKLFNIVFPEKWTWQIGYETAIRLTFVSLWVSVIAFCVKMLKAYFNLMETINHKLIILKSMPTLVNASGEHDEQFRSAYNKIFDMLINIGNLGILSKEADIDSQKILDILKDFKKD